MAAKALFVCAPGAGGHKDDSAMRRLAAALEPHGFEVVRFNFPYTDKGSKRIDPMPVLKACFSDTALKRKKEGTRLIIGGRSMGGRVASLLAADGFPCDGLLLAAYPLHPSGQPEKLRDVHLSALRCPVLCFSGTRDPLCTRDLMKKSLEKVTAPWTQHWLEGADHSFRVLKSSGRTEADVDAEIGAAARKWLEKSVPDPDSLRS